MAGSDTSEAQVHPALGRFLNTVEGENYLLRQIRVDRWGLLWTKTIYEFLLLNPPLMWYGTIAGRTGYWQMDRHSLETDLGSVPPPLRGFFPHDRFILPYLFHDDSCAYGGLWLYEKETDAVPHAGGKAPCEFIPITRREGNLMLRDMVHAQGGTVVKYPILLGVFIGRIGAAVRRRFAR